VLAGGLQSLNMAYKCRLEVAVYKCLLVAVFEYCLQVLAKGLHSMNNVFWVGFVVLSFTENGYIGKRPFRDASSYIQHGE